MFTVWQQSNITPYPVVPPVVPGVRYKQSLATVSTGGTLTYVSPANSTGYLTSAVAPSNTTAGIYSYYNFISGNIIAMKFRWGRGVTGTNSSVGIAVGGGSASTQTGSPSPVGIVNLVSAPGGTSMTGNSVAMFLPSTGVCDMVIVANMDTKQMDVYAAAQGGTPTLIGTHIALTNPGSIPAVAPNRYGYCGWIGKGQSIANLEVWNSATFA